MSDGKDTTDKAIMWNPGDPYGKNNAGEVVKVPKRLSNKADETPAPLSVDELEDQPEGDDEEMQDTGPTNANPVPSPSPQGPDTGNPAGETVPPVDTTPDTGTGPSVDVTDDNPADASSLVEGAEAQEEGVSSDDNPVEGTDSENSVVKNEGE